MRKSGKDPRIKRYVVRLTLYEHIAEHAALIDLLESTGNKGKAVVSAMINGSKNQKAESECIDDDDIDDLFDLLD